MKASDYSHGHHAVLRIAEVTQRDTIKRWLVNNYVGGAKRLAAWDDHRFSLVWFHSWDVARIGPTMGNHLHRRTWASPATPLRYLKELAAGGLLEVRQRRAGGAVSFRFNRAKCDAIAAEVSAELLAEGIEPEPTRSTVRSQLLQQLIDKGQA